MQKQELDKIINKLSRDQMAKILKDLAADADIEQSVVVSIGLAQSVASKSFRRRISSTFGRKPKQEIAAQTKTASTETVPPTNTASTQTTTPNLPVKAPSKDILLCDNCLRPFRLSDADNPYVYLGCKLHTGRIAGLKTFFDDEGLELLKQKYTAKGQPFPDKFWTCCFNDPWSPGCNVLPRHVAADEYVVTYSPTDK